MSLTESRISETRYLAIYIASFLFAALYKNSAGLLQTPELIGTVTPGKRSVNGFIPAV